MTKPFDFHALLFAIGLLLAGTAACDTALFTDAEGRSLTIRLPILPITRLEGL